MLHLKRFYTISESLRISLCCKAFLGVETRFSGLTENNLSKMVLWPFGGCGAIGLRIPFKILGKVPG